MQATCNNPAVAHEKRSIDSSHGRFEKAVMHALLIRSANNFDDLPGYRRSSTRSSTARRLGLPSVSRPSKRHRGRFWSGCCLSGSGSITAKASTALGSRCSLTSSGGRRSSSAKLTRGPPQSRRHVRRLRAALAKRVDGQGWRAAGCTQATASSHQDASCLSAAARAA